MYYIIFSLFLLIIGQQGPHFAMIKLTWENAYDYCVSRGQRLVYSMADFPDLTEVLAESNIR